MTMKNANVFLASNFTVKPSILSGAEKMLRKTREERGVKYDYPISNCG